MATKPAALPVWNTDATNRTTPSGGKQASGFLAGEQPSSSFQNWWQNLVYQWADYLNAPLGVTTTPAINATAGTGGGSVALRGKNGDNSSVPVLGVAAGVDGATEASFLASSFPGSAVMGLTGVSGLPGVIGANVATGPGVWGTNSGAAGAGVYGTGGAVGTFGGVFAGNAQNIATLNTDATAAAPGAGVAVGATGSTVAGYFKQYGTTRGTIMLQPQAVPSAPAQGDLWSDSARNGVFEYYDGTAVRPVGPYIDAYNNAVSATLSNFTARTTFSNGTFVIPANTLRVGSVIEVLFGVSGAANAVGVSFAPNVDLGSVSISSNASQTTSSIGSWSQCYMIRMVVKAIGASGSCAYWRTTFTSTNNSNSQVYAESSQTSSTFNTTSALNLLIRTNCSAANAGNTAILDYCTVRVWY